MAAPMGAHVCIIDINGASCALLGLEEALPQMPGIDLCVSVDLRCV